MKNNIQGSFDQVRKALDFREKLLIRQVQVLEQQASQFTKEIQFIPENQMSLQHLIRTFGKFNVSKLNVGNDYLSNEDYIRPQDDHVLINKQLIEETPIPTAAAAADHESQQRTTAALHLAMVDDNANNINESLINLILSESKELIGKSKMSKQGNKNKEGRHGNQNKLPIGDTPVRGTMESKPVVAAAPVPAPIPKKLSSSLKGISNLTFNSGTLNLRRPTAIPPTITDYDVQAVTCDFYNRLINENKLLRPHHRRSTANADTLRARHKPDQVDVSPTPSSSSSGTSSTSFKEFCTGVDGTAAAPALDNWDECDGLPMDANGNVTTTAMTNEDRPKQIQLWLKQISHEPELENTELLEFSLIKSP